MDRKRRRIEERRDAPERKGRKVTAGVRCKFREQGGGEGAVHDEPVIALDIARIATVVVDPVAVEGERRITEEQDLARGDRLADVGVRRRGFGLPLRCVDVGVVAVDEILLLDDAARAVDLRAMRHRDETEGSRLALLDHDVIDGRDRGRVGPDRYRGVELEAAAGPHTAGEGDRRQETAALWVAVDAETSGRGDLEEEGNVPHRREWVADGEDGLVVEGEFEATHDAWLDRMDDDLLAADPVAEDLDVVGGGGHRLILSPSPSLDRTVG